MIARLSLKPSVIVTPAMPTAPEATWTVWTTPARFKRWWVPKSMPLSLLSYEADIRVGGGYRLVFDVDGTKTMAFFGKYIEVTPYSRIVWTNDESGEDGAITTVTLEEKGDKTLLVIHEADGSWAIHGLGAPGVRLPEAEMIALAEKILGRAK